MNIKLISLMLALMFTSVFAAARQPDREFVDDAGKYKCLQES